MTIEPTNDVTYSEPTPGQMLRSAREKKQWSQKESANQLNLGLSFIESMEADVYDQKMLPTYIRGYLRSYARLLKISEHDVLKAYEQLHGAKPVEPRAMHSFSNRTEKEATENRFMLVTYMVIAILVAMLLIWWWQTHWLTDTATETSTDPMVLSESSGEHFSIDPMPTNRMVADAELALHSLESEPAPSATLQPEPPEWVNNPADFQGSSVSTEAAAAPELVGQSSLKMRFNDDCWIDVVDAEGSRVAFGTKKAGYQLQVQGVAPFTVTLGNPTVVDIDLNDHAIDLSAFNTGRVAKFSVPLQD